MDEGNYQKLLAIDENTLGDSHNVHTETHHEPTYNAHMPFTDIERLEATQLRQSPDSSESRPSNNISVETEAFQSPTYAVRTPSPDVEAADAGPPHQDWCTSQQTTSTDILVNESDPTHGPDTSHHDTPLLSAPVLAGPATSQEQPRQDSLLANSYQQEHAQEKSAEPQRPRWTMFYFRLPFLVPFSVLLALIIVGLEVLYQTSQHNQGLVTASESMEYVWTYGPTFCEAKSTGPGNFGPCTDGVHSPHHDRSTLGPIRAMCEADNAMVHNEPW